MTQAPSDNPSADPKGLGITTEPSARKNERIELLTIDRKCLGKRTVSKIVVP